MTLTNLFTTLKGSSRSGNYGHSGRPGKRGGSGSGFASSLETPNLNITLNRIGNNLFVEARQKSNKLNWAELASGADKSIAVEGTYNLNVEGDPTKAYGSQLNSWVTGKGLGYETARAVFDELKRNGVKEVRGYVVNTNYTPVSMNKKLGGVIEKETPTGTYWLFKL